jgi:hypothetical protein
MQFEDQFTKPWYPYTTDVAPLNAKPASYVFGSGSNTLTIEYGTCEAGNGFTVAVAVAETASADMTVAFADGALTITLGTDATESPITADDTKNTYALIAAEINDIDGFTATVVGSGVIDAAAEADEFTDGQYGTVCNIPGTFIYKSATEWYVNIAPNSKWDANWRKLTVATY